MIKAKAALCALALLAPLMMAPATAAQPVDVSRPLAPAAGAPGALSALVDRYVAWRGGAVFKALRSVHERGGFEQGGLTGTFENWAGDQRWRSETRIGGMRITQVTTAAQSWGASISGQILDTPEAFARAHRLDAIEYGDALRGGDGATAVLAGDEAWDGQIWSVVRVSFGDNDVYEAFIDPATGALGGFRVRERGQLRTERFSDWRWVDGVRVAFLETDQSDSDGTIISRTQSIELNGPLDPSLFERPPLVRKAVFADGAGSTGWIDFDFYAGRQIYIPVKVNGHDTVALLDNGASASFLDQSYAASIGLRTAGAFNTPGTGGVGTSGRISGVDIQVGNLSLRDLTVGTLDFATMSRVLDHPLPLILGDEAFNELIVDIDFAHHRIAFHDPASFVVPANAVRAPMVRANGSRLVALSLEDGPPALFSLDIGDAGTLDISPAYARERKLLDGRLTLAGRAAGIGGVNADIIATLNKVEFAGVSFTGVPAAFPQTWPSATYTDRAQGLVGIGVLSRFRLIVDWAHDALYTIPNPDAAAAAFVRDRLGMGWVSAPQGLDAFVAVVIPNSPAAAAGFKVGDRIVRIDGRAIRPEVGPAWDAAHEGPVGTKVEFTLADGATRTVTLADYY